MYQVKTDKRHDDDDDDININNASIKGKTKVLLQIWLEKSQTVLWHVPKNDRTVHNKRPDIGVLGETI